MILNLLASYKKDQLCENMDYIYSGLLEEVKAREDYSKSLKNLGTCLVELVKAEIPQFEKEFQEISDLLSQYSDSNSQFAQAQHRNADDFRDVSERFFVVYRINVEYVMLNNAYVDALTAYNDAKSKNESQKSSPKYDQMKEKLEANIKSSFEALEKCYEDRKVKLEQFIIAKEKYSDFKVRRFKQGWTRYTNGLKTFIETNTGILNEIRAKLQGLAQKIPKEKLESINNSILEHLSNEPIPSNYPPKIAHIENSLSPIELNSTNEKKDEEIKQEEIKQEETKQEETKQEEIKQEEIKQEEIKQEEEKQEEIKQEETKQEIEQETIEPEISNNQETTTNVYQQDTQGFGSFGE